MKKRIRQYLYISSFAIAASFLVALLIYLWRTPRGLEEFLHVHLWVSFSFAILGGLMVRGSMMGPRQISDFSEDVRREYELNRKTGGNLGMEIFFVGLTCLLVSYVLNKKFGILRDNASAITQSKDSR